MKQKKKLFQGKVGNDDAPSPFLPKTNEAKALIQSNKNLFLQPIVSTDSGTDFVEDGSRREYESRTSFLDQQIEALERKKKAKQPIKFSNHNEISSSVSLNSIAQDSEVSQRQRWFEMFQTDFETSCEKRKAEHLKYESETLNRFDQMKLSQKKGGLNLQVDISDEEADLLYNAMNAPAGEIVVKNFKASIPSDAIRSLQPGTWLNDEIINQYMYILKERSEFLNSNYPDLNTGTNYFQSSFFYTKLAENGYNYANVRRWTKRGIGKVDLFSQDKAFYPINVSNTHWCLCVLFITEKRIAYYDSMGGSGAHVMENMLQYIQDEMEDKKKTTLDVSDWKMDSMGVSIPQQNNGYDCGVFLCTFANYVSANQVLDFSASDMPYFRKRIGIDILKKEATFSV